MGSGASAQLDPAALNNAEEIAAKRAECEEDVDGLKGLCAQIKEENDLLVDYIARRDAILMHKACDGLGTDEDALTTVVCGRTKKHLQAVDLHYREAHDGKKMHDLIKGETSGSLGKMLTWRCMELVEFRAAMMDLAMDGLGTDEDLLTETLVTCSNAEIMELREYYQATRDKSLIERITSETSGEFEMFLTKIMQAERDESEDVDEGAAAESADALYKGGVGNWWGTDEELFINTLVGANPMQCNAIATAYENAQGKSLASAIKSEFGSDTANGLTAMLSANPADCLAKRLRKAMKGMGTDEKAIARVLAGAGDFESCRAVAARFFELEDRSLADALEGELGGLFEGNFKRATLAVVTDPPPHEPTNGKQAQVDALGDIEEDDGDAVASRLDLLTSTNEALKEHIAFMDAKAVWKACNGGWTGIGTDEDELISILGNRTKGQLERIDLQYRALYDKTLADEIKGETSGNFKDMLMIMQMGEAECDAYLLRKATKGWGTDETALIQVIAPKSPERLRAMRDMYEARYDQSLMDLVDSETSGWFESDFNLVIKALLARSENVDMDAEPDEDKAAEAAAALQTAMSGLGTDEQAVIDILCTCNPAQITAIRIAFENENGKSLESWLEGDFSGNAQDTLLALCAPPIDYYCKVIRKAMDGMGTDEDSITRVLGSLSKADIGLLKGRYFEKYDIDLDVALKGDVGGSWGKAVLTWVAGIDPTMGAEEELEEIIKKVEEEEAREPEEEEVEEDDAASDPPASDEEEDQEEEEEDEEADAEEDERRRRRMEREREQRKRQQQEKKKRAKMMKALRKASIRHVKLKKNIEDAEEEYGEKFHLSMEAEWDDEMYCLQNRVRGGGRRKGWKHFLKKGYWNGKLLRFRTDFGVFIGSIDMRRLCEQLDVEAPIKEERPYTIDGALRNNLKPMPDTFPFEYVVPICVSGRFAPWLFKEAHPDLETLWKWPRKSKLDYKLMKEWYPEIEHRHRGDPYHWLRKWEHMKKPVVLRNGREGKVDWKWYQVKYKPRTPVKRAMKLYWKKNWKRRPALKIWKARKMTPWEYYRNVGYEEGRHVTIKNHLGRFEGTFSPAGYAMMNDCDEEDAWSHFKDAMDAGDEPHIVISDIEVLQLFHNIDVPDPDDESDDEGDPDDEEREYFGSEDEDDDDGGDSDWEGGDDDSQEEEEEPEPPRRRRRGRDRDHHHEQRLPHGGGGGRRRARRGRRHRF